MTHFENTSNSFVRVTKDNPCPHCDKPDWCYFIGELSVCSRDDEPATGWETTTKTDTDGHYFYAPIQEKKSVRPAKITYYYYQSRSGSPFVRTKRIDFGDGRTKMFEQQHWDIAIEEWVTRLGKIERASIPIYRYAEVQKAKAKGELIFIVDGESCADKLWEIGLAATTSIGGMGKWRDTDTTDLDDTKVVIVVDRDTPGIKDATKVSEHFPEAQWLYPYPESKAWNKPPKSQGLDIKDWIEGESLNAADVLAAVKEKAWQKPAEVLKDNSNQDSPVKSKNKRLLNLIQTQWGERLKMNEMTLQIEMDGAEINIDQVYFQMAEELDIDVPKQKASDLVVALAKKNTYSPIRDYLDSLTDITPINLDNLAERYFGTSDPLHQILLKRTLIAGVARAYDPGCKHDTLLILQGGQGFLKSTFLMELIGKAYFTDNLNDGNEKDEKLKLRRYWGLEYSEFETAFKRKEVEQLKAFLSSPVDSLRVPYGKSIENFPRTSFFVGSTNRQEFLNDPTGERRYWVIPVSRQIPIQMVRQERDAIWAAAIAAYKAGEQWHLTYEEDNLLAESNKGWQSSDVWETKILSYLEFRESCTVGELLEKVIGMDLAQQKKVEQMRVSDILRCNGWTRTTKRIDGKLHKSWQRVVTGGNGVVTEVVTAQNPISINTLDKVLPPVTTSDSNFSILFDLTTESKEIEKNKSFETIGGNTPAATSETLTAQSVQPVTTSLLPPLIHELNEDEFNLLEMIQMATAEPDIEIARQAAVDILPILKDVCTRGSASREKVWAALADPERTRFSELTKRMGTS